MVQIISEKNITNYHKIYNIFLLFYSLFLMKPKCYMTSSKIDYTITKIANEL